MNEDIMLPFTFEVVTEEELLMMGAVSIADTIVSKDRYLCHILSFVNKDQDRIVAKFVGKEGELNKGKQFPETVWREILLTPSTENGSAIIDFPDGKRCLSLITGLNEKNAFVFINDGIVIVDVGYDADSMNLFIDIIKNNTFSDFFSGIGEQIVSALIGSSPIIIDDDDNPAELC